MRRTCSPGHRRHSSAQSKAAPDRRESDGPPGRSGRRNRTNGCYAFLAILNAQTQSTAGTAMPAYEMTKGTS